MTRPVYSYLNPSLRVAQLWRAGHDTFVIAERMGLTEPDVCRLLARWRDARRASA